METLLELGTADKFKISFGGDRLLIFLFQSKDPEYPHKLLFVKQKPVGLLEALKKAYEKRSERPIEIEKNIDSLGEGRILKVVEKGQVLFSWTAEFSSLFLPRRGYVIHMRQEEVAYLQEILTEFF